MGGDALKHTKTERKDIKDYTRIKTHILEELSKHLVCKAVIEVPEKESFGDLDVLYICDDKIVIQDLINELFNPHEIVNNGPVTSFDYDNFQIDFMKSTSLEEFNSKMFYFAYGDLGCLMGKMINFYKIKFGDRGLWIDIDNSIDNKPLGVKCNIGKEILLTNEPKQICEFLELNYELWKNGFSTKQEIFEWLCSSKYFKKNIFNVENGADRNRMENRKMYMDFMKWLWGGDGTPTEPKPDKEYIQHHAITYFNKQDELEAIVGEVKLREIRKLKYNGKLFVDKGTKPTLIVQTMSQFEKYIEKVLETDFIKWLDSTDKENVQILLNKFFLTEH